MFSVIIILGLIACVILALAVLVQNPKGGGLSGTFGGAANQLFGYKRTTDDIEKWTWYLVIFVFISALGSAAFKPGVQEAQNPFSPEAQQPAIQQPLADPNAPQNAEPIDGGALENSTDEELPTE